MSPLQDNNKHVYDTSTHVVLILSIQSFRQQTLSQYTFDI
jgi:hypothetical protein